MIPTAPNLLNPAFLARVGFSVEPVALSSFWAFYDCNEASGNMLDITGNARHMAANTGAGSTTGVVSNCRYGENPSGASPSGHFTNTVDLAGFSDFNDGSDWSVCGWFKTDNTNPLTAIYFSGSASSSFFRMTITPTSIGLLDKGANGMSVTKGDFSNWTHVAFGNDSSLSSNAWIQVGYHSRVYETVPWIGVATIISMVMVGGDATYDLDYDATCYLDNIGLSQSVLTPAQVRWLASQNTPT